MEEGFIPTNPRRFALVIVWIMAGLSKVSGVPPHMKRDRLPVFNGSPQRPRRCGIVHFGRTIFCPDADGFDIGLLPTVEQRLMSMGSAPRT